MLLKLLVEAFVPAGPVIIGLDETIERRRGRKLTARAIYRDAARSSKACFQKSSGLRWMSLALLVPVGWAARVSRAALSYRPVSFRTLQPLRASRPAAQAADRACAGPPLAKCAGGCRIGRSSWWPIAATPPWSCWPGARGRLDP